ncbi:transposase [Halococcus morrhuae DSM 1307]|uniref:Transposase n=1 Tax=Halococcus morrhuae DSM 1307 TaxID=931277 RepID=M0MRE9_HALMO|nr:transposase [Halococcus morrhuae DSM 1307]
MAECRDLCEWFGVSRTRAAIHHWYQSFAEHYDQNFTAEPDRVAVDEKQIQIENEQKVSVPHKARRLTASECEFGGEIGAE